MLTILTFGVTGRDSGVAIVTKYLLPCSCGEKTTIEISQAGQTIQCSCGKSLDIPTMQGIRRLEPFLESESEVKASSYGGVIVGVALIGLMIFAAGGTYTGWKSTRRPIPVNMDYMSPWDTWLMWQSLREGVRIPEFAESPYTKAMKEHRRYMAMGTVFTILGGLIITGAAVANFFYRRSQRSGKMRRAP